MAPGKKAMSIRLAEELADALRERAEEESTTVTELITRYIREGLSDKAELLEKVEALQNKLEVIETEFKETVKETVSKAFEEVQGGLRKVEGQTELVAKLVKSNTPD